jgi:hypothetical protein
VPKVPRVPKVFSRNSFCLIKPHLYKPMIDHASSLSGVVRCVDLVEISKAELYSMHFLSKFALPSKYCIYLGANLIIFSILGMEHGAWGNWC